MLFLCTILNLSPIIKWLFGVLTETHLSLQINVNTMELITAIITTLLLMFLTLLVFGFARKLSEANNTLKTLSELLTAFKVVSRLSSYYRAYRIYTREGLGMTYYDERYRDRILTDYLFDEYKYVFELLQEQNKRLSIGDIFHIMIDYYGCTEQELKEAISRK